MGTNKLFNRYFDAAKSGEDGFIKVLKKRAEMKHSLKKRLSRYYLTDNEIDTLFEIIENAELDIEKIKRDKKYSKDYTLENLEHMKERITKAQEKMRDDFNKKLRDMVKKKIDKAKKSIEKKKQ